MVHMSAPAGWYPDPQHPVPGAAPQQRYWDGQAWTLHVAAIGHPAVQVGPAPRQTPDGAQLAGWGHRLGAYVIDGLILSVIVVILAYPFVQDVITSVGAFVDQAMTAVQNGSTTPSSTQLELDLAGAALAIAAISLAVNLVYTIAFLSWKQATPGKLALGLRVRLRETPDLPLATILLRWATQTGAPGLIALVPIVGVVGSGYAVLDGLWPLWDDKRQALHDKVAQTNVVRVR